MYGGRREGILREEDKGKSGDGGRDNDDNDTDGTDNACAGDLPPQTPPPATGSCLIHDFLGIAGFEQCLVEPRLVDNSEDKDGSPVPQ